MRVRTVPTESQPSFEQEGIISPETVHPPCESIVVSPYRIALLISKIRKALINFCQEGNISVFLIECKIWDVPNTMCFAHPSPDVLVISYTKILAKKPC